MAGSFFQLQSLTVFQMVHMGYDCLVYHVLFLCKRRYKQLHLEVPTLTVEAAKCNINRG